jgi:hypothetical protein
VRGVRPRLPGAWPWPSAPRPPPPR